eukprot:m.236284 g.236284  ORF g.236284 m.236284 type:complete len:948 (-) comp12952_c0_seq1:298-3141(-)
MKSIRDRVRKASKAFTGRTGTSESSMGEGEHVMDDSLGPDAAVASTRDVSEANSQADGSEGDDDSIQDIRFIDSETLNTLTQLIHQFSERMNHVLSKMASAEPGPVRKEACAALILDVKDCVVRTAAESNLNWTNTVLASANRLISLVNTWDPITSATPDRFSEIADALLKTYTHNISSFLKGAVPADEEDLPTEPLEIEDDPDEGLRERLQEVLVERVDGVGSLLAHAKRWSKYTKEVVSFLEKRAALEQEYSKKMAALVKNTTECLEEYAEYACATTSLQPLLKEYAQIANRNLALHSGPTHFMQVHPLDEFRTNHERQRKQLKDTWTRECRRLADSVAALQRAKTRYVQMCQEWEKALGQRQKEEASKYKLKLDKRSKEETDLRARVEDARKAYEQAVRTANTVIADVTTLRATLVSSLLDTLFQGGEVLKDCLVCYQQEELTSTAPKMSDLERLADNSRNDPASQRALLNPDPQAESFQMLPPFMFEAFELSQEVADYLPQVDVINLCVDPAIASSRLESVSPVMAKRTQDPDPVGLHQFVKHTIPSKCRHCRHACYFQAVACTQCGIVVHRRCTELLQTRCKVPSSSMLASPRRVSTVFGSPLAAQVENGVPIIVRRIIQTIERRGLAQEGLYRITGVKSHVERLCADFETNPRSVDVDREDVHVLTAVLKLYFRQLPEPVVPIGLSSRFLQIAKDLAGHKKDDTFVRQAVERARLLVEELPPVNYDTLAFTIVHLTRVSELSEINKMKPSNLGIVFGPTLLRNETDTLDTLMDMPHQTVMAELMIEHCYTIFTRYLQSHNVPFTETPAMRRIRRPYTVEPLYATVPEIIEEVAAIKSSTPPAAYHPTHRAPSPPRSASGSLYSSPKVTRSLSSSGPSGSALYATPVRLPSEHLYSAPEPVVRTPLAHAAPDSSDDDTSDADARSAPARMRLSVDEAEHGDV